MYNNKDMAGDFLNYYNQYKDKIFNYFWYRLDFNRALSEDMTQDVFFKALDKFDSFDPERSFQAWIFRIAKNHLINHYRVARRETALTEAESRTIDAVEKLNIDLELEDVFRAINVLPEKFREVLSLRYADSLDNGEIASILEISEGTVRTRICRALEILRKSLKNR
ncbi:hypothetical protein A2303_03895 [Candidatus Falkowbacteria bacterium RIFOXYB2_FULL_47_14]|uniref:HTH luxR-type domain-containing protein n=1 Tax=Candidatus Falkowbacteria bacterium RIFOXYA2_FULL_47_19 TaxID=1797994 RepID=A0A1F5SIM7_9BACT|nr:MAG: hypothetical protein A2227_03440 [Candidatus Falkowbacteria bacterium RIFOXYA2_FULL_47_19]OGF37289.1 MAG: hypothetical protein A2468_01480 [Candidatus Falkowbacteria bacterium RIFOXYC2_FULL_46_15]OGF42539.1 MAG: hypothetical protein A2303_03895 [Candidatus Falkowbacteria bacterium RIFOXYB2_FULL_47_14]